MAEPGSNRVLEMLLKQCYPADVDCQNLVKSTEDYYLDCRFRKEETGLVTNLGRTDHSRILFRHGEVQSTVQYVQHGFQIILLRLVKL